MTPRLLVMALLSVTLAALVATPTSPASEARSRAAKQVRLKAFPSCSGLIRYGRGHARAGPGAVPPPAIGAPQPLTGAPAPSPSPDQRSESLPQAAEDDSSQTNVQEAGVDEPDLVKAAAGRLFVVAGGRLHSIDATGAPRLLGSLELDGWGHQLLLSGRRLLVIGQDAAIDAPAGAGGWASGATATRRQGAPGDDVTQLTEVDVSRPAAMRVVRTERIRGHHVSSRLSGRTARVVVWTRPRALGQPELRSALRGWLPRRVLRKRSGGRPRFRPAARCRRVFRPAAYSGVDLLTVLTIDLSEGLPAVDSDAIMSGGQVVYASPRNLYVATPRWTAEPDSGADMPPVRALTTIHRFAASDPDSSRYNGSGAVPGYLLNQFSMSEHRGVLRVASTELPAWWQGGEGARSESFVTTLGERDGALAELGRVGGLGRDERIYAVRFIADAGYVVTFRQVDPLYVVDLGDPGLPRVVGELKVRGYSAYLHPLANDLLLGVGQDATERGRLLGTQLSLFDVADPSRPERLHRRSLGELASSEVEYDHHAFLWWAPKRLAVVPVSSYGDGGPGFFGAVGFKLGRSSGIDEAGRASHNAAGHQATIRRSLVVAGKLITISDVGIEANSLDTLAEEAWLAFP